MTRSTPVDTLQGMDQLILAFPKRSRYLELPFSDGTTPLERTLERVSALAGDGIPISIVLAPQMNPLPALERFTVHHRSRKIVQLADADGSGALLRILDSIESEAEHLIWLDGDAPFVSIKLAIYLDQLHRRSWCDYTFADGFPVGYAPQCVRRETVGVLATLAGNRGLTWNRSLLFDALSIDINAFDIETEAASEDYSLLRASLTADMRANYLLCRRLVERDVTPSGSAGLRTDVVFDPFSERFPEEEDEILQTLLADPTILRTAPRYYQLQLTERLTQRPSYTPWAAETREEPPRDLRGESLTHILREIVQETPEATIAIGYRGEPGLHNDLPGIVDIFQKYPDFDLYLETSGVGWTETNMAALDRWQALNAIIVELDAFKTDTYRALRGEGFEEALGFIEHVRVVHPDKIYVQATRMADNEWELQEFFTYWSSVEGVQPLIQKYNNFAGRLPDRRVADLAPLNRVPCRHLERDMVILVDGSVPRCHQDIDRVAVRGSILEERLWAIWERGDGDYRAHIAKAYPELCGDCDEYYTINA